ncbi:sulfite exporter TauE/SafE family protein [Bacillaceae bacterium Marseille-Q3522]|nr:sulfite exporter TauE/SafE family protein [Bacillaceae bacterium Marseille-Q3522]
MNEISLISIFFFAILLGLKHAIEPDHVIAVSTVASRSKMIRSATLAGVFWGIGHTITLFGMGMVFVMLKSQITDNLAMSLEFVVGIMLVFLGLSSLRKDKISKSHDHFLAGTDTVYLLKSMFIGVIHGLAGTGAMVLLTISTVSTIWEGALYILIFGLGTIIGMLILSTIIGIPFVISSKKSIIHSKLTQLTATISILFGIYYMYNLGIKGGLFQLWF